MTVDFRRVLDEQRAREALHDDEADIVITFEVTRGSFTIPAAMLEDDADEWELRRLFARSLPDHDDRAVLNTSRQAHKDGSATVTWRRVVTHVRRA